jgi:hypothetical protein
MNENGKRPQPLDLAEYVANRSRFPAKELANYAGKHVAFSADGTRIVAAGDDLEQVLEKLRAEGISPSQVVHSYVDPPDLVQL